MKITKIDFTNFRKAKNKCTLKINDQTLIVGKNNTSKTSIMEIMNKFLSNNSNFLLTDFNYELIDKKKLNELYTRYYNEEDVMPLFPAIEMNLYLTIANDDNLFEIKELLYEFENNENIIIKCKYSIENISNIFAEYCLYNDRIKEDEKKLEFCDFFERNYSNYYKKRYYTTKENSQYLNAVDSNCIYKLFKIYSINAQRDVDDVSENEKMTLSNAIWRFYQEKRKKHTSDLESEDIFKDALNDIKSKLDNTYSEYFEDLINVLNNEISNDENNKQLKIVSDFDIENMLKKNSKVKYFYNETSLSESSNGLGYSNLLYIYIKLESFKFEINNSNSLFNIIFLEEPESHLHPQMQSVLLRKINDIFKECNLYSIISTHSSYILKSTEIKNINYFMYDSNGLKIKALQDFIEKEEYATLKDIIKKYFILNTCDLFFADKVIFIEGMAERLLIPSFFSIFDLEHSEKISKQHISIFEVGGRHTYIFQELVAFLEIKSLMITDIDTVVGTYNSSCPTEYNSEEIKTTNPTILNYFGLSKSEKINEIIKKYSSIESRLKANKTYSSLLTFQLPSKDYNFFGRTLEEQVIIENTNWIITNLSKLPSIENIIELFKNGKYKDYNDEIIKIESEIISEEELIKYKYEIVKRIDKSLFALDMIENEGWSIPKYILEGLEWISK